MSFDLAVSLAAELIHEITGQYDVPIPWDSLPNAERKTLELRVVDALLDGTKIPTLFPDLRHQRLLNAFKRRFIRSAYDTE